MCACANFKCNITRDGIRVKMADNTIPGLDGDLPPDRGLLPDSLQVKSSNGESVGYNNQQARPGQPADPTATHPKVVSGRYLEYSCISCVCVVFSASY